MGTVLSFRNKHGNGNKSSGKRKSAGKTWGRKQKDRPHLPSPFTCPFTCSIYQPTGLSANQVFYAAVKRSRQGEQPGGGSLPYVLGSLLILLDHAERYTGAL